MNDNTISIGDANEWIVRIHMDGRVEINPKHTLDEAAKAFWDAVIKMNPMLQKP